MKKREKERREKRVKSMSLFEGSTACTYRVQTDQKNTPVLSSFDRMSFTSFIALGPNAQMKTDSDVSPTFVVHLTGLPLFSSAISSNGLFVPSSQPNTEIISLGSPLAGPLCALLDQKQHPFIRAVRVVPGSWKQKPRPWVLDLSIPPSPTLFHFRS